MNIYDFVKSYGKHSFEDKAFNEVDNVILSELMYLDFTGIVDTKKESISLKEAGTKYLRTHKKLDIYKLGIAQKDAYDLLLLVIDSKRYQNILLSNYRYITSLDSQFSSLVFDVSKNLKYIGFEGTDEYISGWKEDAYLAIKFPVDAQKYAINYLNEVVSLFDKKIIVGGHSKGGNLALVASMYARIYIKKKIIKIYSNDGPGLRDEEFNSSKYHKIKGKYIHIIPNYSIVGVMLNNDHYYIVESSKRNIFAHAASNWIISKDHFKVATQNIHSCEFEQRINSFLLKTPRPKLEKNIKKIFAVFEKKGITTVMDIINIRTIFSVIDNLKTIDEDIKRELLDILDILIKYFI